MAKKQTISKRIGLYLYGRWVVAYNWLFPRFDVLFDCRVSLIVGVLCLVLMVFLPQGRELAYTVKEHPWKYFTPAVFLAFISWHWARASLDTMYGRRPPRGLDDWIDWTPRIAGGLPLAAATLAIFRIWWDPEIELRDAPYDELSQKVLNEYFHWALVGVGLLVVFEVLVFARRAIASRIHSRVGGARGGKVGDFLGTAPGSHPSGAPFPKLILWGLFALALAAIVINVFKPTWLGGLFGAGGGVFIAAMVYVTIFGALVLIFERLRKQLAKSKPDTYIPAFPVITLAVLASLLFSCATNGDRNAYFVRKYDKAYALPPDEARALVSRPFLDTAIQAWYDANKDTCTRNGKLDIVIVASAGGALRAAMWTGSILGALQDKLPEFKKCLLAISSVSGGSLGAVAFLSAIREGEVATPPHGYEERIRNGLNYDFLGPVMVSLVVNDGLFAPFHKFGTTRATALETAWEEHWRETGKTEQYGLDSDFLSLWDENVHWPILLLNGTHAQTGRRILTSNVDTEGKFVDAYDFFAEFPESIHASTAVHNSARFSYISPAGGLPKGNGQAGHIIDGGYFENYGAETALEFITHVERIASDNKWPEHLRFQVIQIASDPDLPDRTISSELCEFPDSKLERLVAENSGQFESQMGSDAVSQVTVPVKGLLQTRESRGIHAAKRLACLPGVDLSYHFINLRVGQDHQKPPLSWFLSDESMQEICTLIGQTLDSPRAIQKILVDLGLPENDPRVRAVSDRSQCAANN